MSEIEKALEILTGKPEPTPLDILLKAGESDEKQIITRPAKKGVRPKNDPGQRGLQNEGANVTDEPLPGNAYGHALFKAADSNMEFEYQQYMAKSKNVKREDMPQITIASTQKFLELLKKDGLKYKKVKRKLSSLKPTQKEINEDFVLDRMRKKSKRYRMRQYIASADGYLLDGHHDWAYGLEIDPEKEVTVYLIAAPIKKLVKVSNEKSITKNKDINGDEIKKAIEVIQHIKANPWNYSRKAIAQANSYKIVETKKGPRIFRVR